MPDFQIRTSDGKVGEMLRKLADDDMRSMGAEVAWIIRQEWARRGCVSVETLPTDLSKPVAEPE